MGLRMRRALRKSVEELPQSHQHGGGGQISARRDPCVFERQTGHDPLVEVNVVPSRNQLLRQPLTDGRIVDNPRFGNLDGLDPNHMWLNFSHLLCIDQLA